MADGGVRTSGSQLDDPVARYCRAVVVPFLIVVLSLAGLANSIYFTLAYYGRVKKSRWIPEILCAREGSSCVTVVRTPYARVFGVPNSLLGVIYYLLLISWTALLPHCGFIVLAGDLCGVFMHAGHVLLALSAATVVLGLYLIYALRRKLHMDCPLCYTAHAINAALLVLLMLLWQ